MVLHKERTDWYGQLINWWWSSAASICIQLFFPAFFLVSRPTLRWLTADVFTTCLVHQPLKALWIVSAAFIAFWARVSVWVETFLWLASKMRTFLCLIIPQYYFYSLIFACFGGAFSWRAGTVRRNHLKALLKATPHAQWAASTEF